MASWSYTVAMTNIYIDGVLDVIQYWNNEYTELINTARDYEIGLDRNASSSLHGYLRDLFAFSGVCYDNGLQAQRMKGKNI